MAGVDEAGRGAWAGPLVAAAVILAAGDAHQQAWWGALRDSKQLSQTARERLFGEICDRAVAASVGAVCSDEIDLIGLTAANELAMVRAIRALTPAPEHLLVDAFRLRSCQIRQTPIVKGDQLSVSIAAASIVAKVVRDRWMHRLDSDFPAYALRGHKGYGVPSHRDALARHGVTAIHRRSYAPIRSVMSA